MKKNKTTDFIHLHGLRLKCRIGVSPCERRKKQIITADIALKCDLRRAGQSDRLKDTVDYSVIAKAVAAMAKKRTFYLLESLAEHIVKICLTASKVNEVTVKVAKKGILPNVRSVEIEITRKVDTRR